MPNRALLGSGIGLGAAFAIWEVLRRVITTDPAADTATRLALACAALLPAVSPTESQNGPDRASFSACRDASVIGYRWRFKPSAEGWDGS